MTDERYVYNTDIRERKSAANGARAKKGGSRSKRCHLPSDNMTAAQKRQLNGPTVAVNLNRPMTFTELKQISPTLQFLYLDHLVKVHKARAQDIYGMLGISKPYFYVWINDLPGRITFKGKPRRPAAEWLAFLANAQPAQEATQALDEGTPPCTPPEKQNAPTEPTAPTEPHAVILGGSMKVRGTLLAMINAIMCLVDEPDQEYTFTVHFEK